MMSAAAEGDQSAADRLLPVVYEQLRKAAQAFLDDVAPGTRVGLVTFAATAVVRQPLSHDRDALFGAIRRLDTERTLGYPPSKGLKAGLELAGKQFASVHDLDLAQAGEVGFRGRADPPLHGLDGSHGQAARPGRG